MDVGTDLATFEADGDDRVRAPRPLGLAGRLVAGQVKLSQHEVQPLETLQRELLRTKISVILEEFE